ncbi:protein containing conserved repeat domain, partial [Bacteroidales bacterium 6E]
MKNYLPKLQETKGNPELITFQAISQKSNPVIIKINCRFRSFLTAILLIVALTMGITPIYDVQGNTFDISSIYKHGKPIELSQQVGGATIIVSADHGVLPKGTTLSVHLLSDVEKQEYIRRLEAYTDIQFIESVAFDISLLNSQGIEIQPNGELMVGIDGVTFNRTGDKTAVYHVENSSKKNLHNISFSKKYIESENNDFSQSTIPVSKHNTIQSKPTKSAISFQTNHFSVYIVGTVATATYNFYVDGILTGSQIILNGEKLLEPNTPMELDGKMFSGWFLSGSSTPLTFGAPVTVNSTVNYDVHAVYEDIWYVYFNYNDNAIATKFVVPGNTTNPSGVPLLVTEPGKAFSHWSVVPDGPAFDFSTPINDNTTLYAVLTDLWTITFSAQGGSTTIPKYVADGQQMGTVTPPTRPGYSFGGWYTESNGTGNLYTETTSIQSSVTLFAKWTPTTVNYTIQYWLENADDEQYTFKETATGTGVSGETLILPSNRMENDRYPYFSFERYDQGLIINGNGTTLVNVYYSRNQYTVRFDLNRSNASMTIGGLTYTDSNNSSDWYSFTAKYDSDVSDLWPTATNVPRTRQNSYSSWYYFYGWSFSSGSSTYVSKRMTFTSDLFSTSGTRTYTGEWITNQTTYELHYMIESPSATGEKHYSGKWYNEDMTYNQTANTSGGSWNAKQISGVTNIGIETDNSAGSDDDIDVYFYYDRNTYQLSFYNYNHEDKVKSFVFGASMTDEYYTPEKPGTLPEGYTFDGWYDNFATSGTPINFASMVMPSNDAILYAKWTPPTSITIVHRVLEPPYPAGNTIEQITVPYGQPLDINVLNGIADVPTGYTIENDLLGWYWYVGDAFVPFDFNRPVYSNVEVFPVWKIETYQVVYDLNGATGTVPVDSKTYYAGANAIILPLGSDVNTPAGKVFTGWLHDENIYYPNEDVLIEGNTSMLAQWGDTPQKTALIYHANNGTGSIKTFDNLAMNQTHTVLANTDENLGFDYGEFTFTGWNTKADATGTWINAGNNIIVGNNSESESNQLYAQWAKITVTKTGVFNDTNVNGKADLGETIIYTFTITNNGLVGLNNIVISDPKISVSGSITFLAPGATDNSTLSGIYELTLLDLQESLVENTATVTGYSPELNIPVSDSDTEFTRLTSCMLEITCPVAFIATAECDLPSPATSVEELISLGFTISESCGNLVISSVDATDGNSNPETIHRTYTILDDLNSNNTPDQGEVVITCIQVITVQDNT